MKLTDLMKNTSAIVKRATSTRSAERKQRKSSGNSADDVLINETERMSKYISDEERQKINSVRDAERHGIMKIGTKNDPADILQKMLLPETTDEARRQGAINLFRLIHSDNIKFWSKNRYARVIRYFRKGKEIKYLMGLDARTGQRVKIPARTKKQLLRDLL